MILCRRFEIVCLRLDAFDGLTRALDLHIPNQLHILGARVKEQRKVLTSSFVEKAKFRRYSSSSLCFSDDGAEPVDEASFDLRTTVGDTRRGDTTRLRDLLSGEPLAFFDAGVGDVFITVELRNDVFFLIDNGSMGVATGIPLGLPLGVVSWFA